MLGWGIAITVSQTNLSCPPRGWLPLQLPTGWFRIARTGNGEVTRVVPTYHGQGANEKKKTLKVQSTWGQPFARLQIEPSKKPSRGLAQLACRGSWKQQRRSRPCCMNVAKSLHQGQNHATQPWVGKAPKAPPKGGGSFKLTFSIVSGRMGSKKLICNLTPDGYQGGFHWLNFPLGATPPKRSSSQAT